MGSSGFSDIEQLRAIYRRFGISVVYVKPLAANQDNEKNQIYLGRGLNAVTGVFPAKYSTRGISSSSQKSHSDQSRSIIEGLLDFYWIDASGATFKAPHAKLIEYFQYPEVRLSGFILGAKWAPKAIRREFQDDFGRRILLLGVDDEGRTFALLLTEKDDPVVGNWPSLPAYEGAPTLFTFGTATASTSTSMADLLKGELTAIVKGGWHYGQRLRPDGSIVEFNANQAGGYTLEALLNISSNSSKKPDKHGHEVKSYGSSRISIMTPAPDGGLQQQLGFDAFMKAYGWTSKTAGRNTQVFNGQHKFGIMCPSSKATLVIDGYDANRHEVADASKLKVVIRRTSDGKDLASWSFDHLASSWSNKHAAAVYVPYEAKKSTVGGRTRKMISFGPSVWFAAGTDVMMLIRAIALGVVFYDPADELAANIRKNRPQWRISSSKMDEVLGVLYRNHHLVTL